MAAEEPLTIPQPRPSPAETSAGGQAHGDRLPHLDMIRGLAALEVCAAHVRGFLMVDYAQSGGGIPARFFYLLTGLHHEAVMIFFVMSGYLVGGSVLRDYRRGRWQWPRYAARRLTRLWVVMIPALLLTLFWDELGAAINPAGYAGASYAQILSGPSHATAPSVASFFGNLLFLQTIAVPTFGSNGPIWSLANEFWYYLLFPLLVGPLAAGNAWRGRAAQAACAVLVMALLPPAITLYGMVWLFGVTAYAAQQSATTARISADWRVGAAALVALALLLIASRAGFQANLDYLIGIAFAAAIPWLARQNVASSLYRSVSFAMSEMSYTLYLTHFPLVAFLYFALFDPQQFAFSLRAILLWLAVIAAAAAYAGVIWWLFERNTAALLKRILDMIPPGKRGA